MADLKICSKCGIEKPLDAFHRDKSRRDGRQWRCRHCCCRHPRRESTPGNNTKYIEHVRAYGRWLRLGRQRVALLRKYFGRYLAITWDGVGTKPYYVRYYTNEEFHQHELKRAARKRSHRGSDWLTQWYLRLAFRKGREHSRLEERLGYTLSVLRTHLERMMSERGMTWQQYLDAHVVIDHIKPLCMFDMKDLQSNSWRHGRSTTCNRCTAHENRVKADKVNGRLVRGFNSDH